jgi:hypothetical protein
MVMRTALVLAMTMTPALAHTQKIVQETTPELIREAIAVGQADKEAGTHRLTTKGIMIGVFTTPFSRVARAARHAKAQQTSSSGC